MSINKIVILDAYTTQPGDLSWERLKAIAPLTTFDRTAPDLTVKRALDADCILTNKTVLQTEVLKALPDLKYIGLLSTGVNVVDLQTATEQGITVTNVPGYSTDSVAQHVLSMLLALTNRIQVHSDSVHQGMWQSSPDFCYTLSPLVELTGKNLGLVGYGAIAKQVARLALAFNMKVKVLNQRSGGRKYQPSELKVPGQLHEDDIEAVDWETLLACSDAISLHCPLTEETHHLFNEKRLLAMKSDAIIINTGRGPLIDEAALASVLKQGHLGGAALDVLSQEPPAKTHPLIGQDDHLKHCLITPHIAWATSAARGRLIDIVADNLLSWQVNPDATQNKVN